MANGVTVTTRMPYRDNLAYGPYAENNWHFSYNGALGAGAEACAEAGRAAIIDFWNEDVENLASLGLYLASSLDETIEFSYVDWEDEDNISQPMDPGSFTSGTSNSLPNEVALCLTFKCDPYGGHRRQSFYNRIYLGPLVQNANASLVTNGPGRPTVEFREDILAAYTVFRESLDVFGLDTARHAVFSPTHDSSGTVSSCWVDDAWDTQRRRGVDPTVKDVWVAP